MSRLRTITTFLLLLAANLAFGENAQQLYREGKEFRAQGKDRKAVKKFEEALNAAKKEQNLVIQMNAHVELAELKDNVVQYKEALNHYKQFSILYKQQTAHSTRQLKDSVTGLQNEVQASYTEIEKKENAIDSLTTKHLEAQLAVKDLELVNKAKELELANAENSRNLLIFILALIGVAAVFIVRGYILKRKGLRILKQLHFEIVEEKRKSEDLLLNILPESIAGELKEYGRTTPSRFDNATVLFTDFKGFTEFSEKHSPEELVKLVDFYFRAFDQIVKKHGVEKIKTIGDAYMCVSGIPTPNEAHAAMMIRAAFEFRDFVNTEADKRQKNNQPFLRMRIGIHSGPLVAGVVGSRKFSYDVWGDTVNIAARMEQSGEAGSINVSESVYELVKDEFTCIYRGEIEAKHKGRMKMYFVTTEKGENDLTAVVTNALNELKVKREE